MWAIYPAATSTLRLGCSLTAPIKEGSTTGLSARRSISARPFLLFEGLEWRMAFHGSITTEDGLSSSQWSSSIIYGSITLFDEDIWNGPKNPIPSSPAHGTRRSDDWLMGRSSLGGNQREREGAVLELKNNGTVGFHHH